MSAGSTKSTLGFDVTGLKKLNTLYKILRSLRKSQKEYVDTTVKLNAAGVEQTRVTKIQLSQFEQLTVVTKKHNKSQQVLATTYNKNEIAAERFRIAQKRAAEELSKADYAKVHKQALKINKQVTGDGFTKGIKTSEADAEAAVESKVLDILAGYGGLI